METNNINCPQCGHSFDVQSILYESIKVEFDQKYSSKIIEVQQQYDKKFNDVKLLEEKIADKIEKGVQDKFKAERNNWEKKLRDQIESLNQSLQVTRSRPQCFD